MRIAYVFQEVSSAGGIRKKVIGQTATWAAMGHDVHLFVYAPEQELAQSPFAAEVKVPATYFTYPGVLQRGQALTQVLRALKAWGADVVYTRWMFLYPAVLGIFRQFPTIVEINGPDVTELGKRSWLLALYVWLTNQVLIRYTAGFVSVTAELAQMNRARRRTPTIVVGNGIVLSEFEPFEAPGNPSPSNVFMATDYASWHGLDKLMLCARTFAHWHFDIIGLSAPAAGMEAPANMTWHGRLPRQSYDSILARADVAWGPVAFHRNNMNEGSSLKTREYLAHGIPLILGAPDADVPEGTPGVLRLPNEEDNVARNLGKIEAFVMAMRGQRVPRECIAQLDAQVKEQRRVEFFESVIARARGRRG